MQISNGINHPQAVRVSLIEAKIKTIRGKDW